MFALVVGAVTLFSLSGIAMAQQYGAVTLSPGFGSQVLSGVSGGPVGTPGGQIDASTYGSTPSGPCRGWIAATPSHAMTLTAPISNLQISVSTNNPGDDTAMLITGPGGTWCNDDTNGLNPAVTGAFQAGTYSIWVASYSMNMNHNYTITFTDLSAPSTLPSLPTAAATIPGLNVEAAAPTDPMGVLTLAPGFTPDPQIRAGQITGTLDSSVAPNAYGGTCRGHIEANPSHMLNLTAPFTYLRAHVRSGSDATLVVRGPDGQFWCNDDREGLNPVIDGPWAAGTWRIWVGSYSSGTSLSYSIEFSTTPLAQ
jgi:hypothetical protein